MVTGTLGTLSREEIFGSLGSNVSIGFVNFDLMFKGSSHDLLS
jgi:hypothetical protein